jgi:hypothetical protein
MLTDCEVSAALHTRTLQTATLPWQPRRTTLPPKESPNLSRNTSTLWHGRNDADTHLRTDHSGPSFSPSAVSEAREALKHWKSIMAGGVYSLLIRKLSLGLLRARPHCFEP